MPDHKEFVIQTLQELGWHINWKKCQLTPSHECVFVGFVITTHKEPWIKVMSHKIRKLRRLIVQVLCHGMTKSVRKTNRLLFLLFWLISCVSFISLIEI